MSNRPIPDGPVAQSVATGFKVLFAAIAVLAVAWAGSNWRQVPADAQAVVLRFKRIVGVKQAGLTLSWPRPIGSVVLVPGEQRLLTVHSQSVGHAAGLTDVFTAASDASLPEGSADYLTGDGGVVLLGATLSYQVTDPAAYYLAEPHVPPALQRLFAASAVTVLAGRRLDDVMVAEPVRANADVQRTAEAEARRQALRGDLVEAVNRRLAGLANSGAPLGIEVARIDLEPSLPPQAKIAYDQVLVAAQMAEQGIADARTEATRTHQVADRERDRLLEAAKASAEERVGEARTRTAAILAVQASMTPPTRDAVLDQVYRDQLASLLQKVGRVTAVDANGARVILPASIPTPAPANGQ